MPPEFAYDLRGCLHLPDNLLIIVETVKEGEWMDYRVTIEDDSVMDTAFVRGVLNHCVCPQICYLSAMYARMGDMK